MKKVLAIVLAMLMMLALFTGCGNDTPAASNGGDASKDNEVYTLRVHHHDPQDSAIGRFLEDWAAKVEEASENRLDIQIFHGGTLGSGNETVSMILNRTCDIGWGGQSSFDGEFPASEIITLPMRGISSSMQGTQVFWNLYKEYEAMQAEYEDFKVLLVSVGCPNGISTKDKVIESIDDIVGMNIRINAGPINDFFQRLGAAPVSVGMGEVYQAIDNNTIDAITSDWHGIYSFSLYEILNSYLNLNIMAGNQFFLMNKDSYNELPADLQAVIDQYSGDYLAEYAGRYWDDVTELCMTAIEENDGNLYTFNEEETAEIQGVADTITEEWIAAAEAGGMPGQDMYDRMLELIGEYAG